MGLKVGVSCDAAHGLAATRTHADASADEPKEDALLDAERGRQGHACHLAEGADDDPGKRPRFVAECEHERLHQQLRHGNGSRGLKTYSLIKSRLEEWDNARHCIEGQKQTQPEEHAGPPDAP